MTRLLAPLFLFALTTGCNDSLDHDSAVKVTNSALGGTIAADVHVMTTNLPSGSVDVTLTNFDGTGTAHVTGMIEKTNGTVSTKVDITFTHWTDHDLTLDGVIHEAGMFSAPLPLSGTVQLTGALTASGAVTGHADFDLTGSYSPSGFSVSGEVGGQSIDATLKVTL